MGRSCVSESKPGAKQRISYLRLQTTHDKAPEGVVDKVEIVADRNKGEPELPKEGRECEMW